MVYKPTYNWGAPSCTNTGNASPSTVLALDQLGAFLRQPGGAKTPLLQVISRIAIWIGANTTIVDHGPLLLLYFVWYRNLSP